MEGKDEQSKKTTVHAKNRSKRTRSGDHDLQVHGEPLSRTEITASLPKWWEARSRKCSSSEKAGKSIGYIG